MKQLRISISFYLLLFLGLWSTPLVAQDTQSLVDQAELVNAKLGLMQAERALQVEIDLADKTLQEATEAAKTDAQARRTATLESIAGLATNMPAGNYTASADGVATPAATEQAYNNLDYVSTTLVSELESELSGKALIFVNTLPGSDLKLELIFYETQAKALTKEAVAIIGDQTQSGIATASLIAALPGVYNAVAGLFRVDSTEQAFSASLSDSTLVTQLIPKVNAINTKPSGIYMSLDAYVRSTISDLESLEIVKTFADLKEQDVILADMLKTIEIATEEKAVAAANRAVESKKAEITEIEFRRGTWQEIAKVDPAQADRCLEQIENLGQALLARKAELQAAGNTLAQAKKELTEKTKELTRITKQRAKIATFLNSLTTAEGSSSLLARLIRAQVMKNMQNAASKIRFLQVSVAASPQSQLNRKSFWKQRTLSFAFLAIEYRLSDGGGKLLKAGIVKKLRKAEVKF